MENNKKKSHSVDMTYKKRRWPKVIEPLLKYNRKSSILGCPIDFYYYIQKILKQGHNLNINIPHTLTGVHDNYLHTIFQSPDDKIGKVVFTPNINKTKFGSLVDEQCRKSLAYLKNRRDSFDTLSFELEESSNSKSHCLPFVVIKQKNDPETMTYIWNIHEYNKTNSIDVNQIVQSYIFCRTPFISVIRFFYSPRSTNRNSCVAYTIENIQKISAQRMNKSQWKVIQSLERSCTFIKIMYQNKYFYQQTLELIRVLQKFLNKSIKRIVTDWIVDINGRYYLIDVKSVDLSQFTSIPKCNKRSVSELLSVMTCSMCLQSFHPSEITKVLTNKLIEKLDNHLQKREIKLSFKINYKKNIDISKVCDLCYCLVVKQHELMQLQKTMGKICNTIKNKKLRSYSNKSLCKFNTNTSQNKLHPSFLYQWRLLLYLEDLKNCQYILDQCQQSKYIYLHLKVCNSVTTFTIDLKRSLQIKGIKLNYLFSKEKSIHDYFINTQILIELSLDPKWGHPIAQGCLHEIYDHNQIRSQAIFQRKYKQILLFTNSAEYSILGMYIGLTLDGVKKTDHLNLEEVYDVYQCSQQYLDCSEFPPEWMEIIDPTYIRKNSDFNMKEEMKEIIAVLIRKIQRTDSNKKSERNINSNSYIISENQEQKASSSSKLPKLKTKTSLLGWNSKKEGSRKKLVL